MSKNKIVEYVMNTPGNTNRTILGQMIDSEGKDTLEIVREMDEETLALAKQYTDSQRIAYEELKSVTARKDENATIPFNTPIGITVTDYFPGRHMLVTPNKKPSVADHTGAADNICNSDLIRVGFHTFNGLLSAPALFVTGLCLVAYDSEQGWAYVYAFETTTDTMGLGLTIEKGWYAINSNTFEIVPIDLARRPVMVFWQGMPESKPGMEAYMEELLPVVEEFTYTVTAENLKGQDDGNYFVAPTKIDYLTSDNMVLLFHTTYFYFNAHDSSGSIKTGADDSVLTLSWTETQKIDPKYLPGVCLPVVELTTPIAGEEINLTEDDIAILEALNGAPCILRWHLAVGEGAQETGITTVSRIGDNIVYTAYSYLGEARFVVGREDGRWGATFF